MLQLTGSVNRSGCPGCCGPKSPHLAFKIARLLHRCEWEGVGMESGTISSLAHPAGGHSSSSLFGWTGKTSGKGWSSREAVACHRSCSHLQCLTLQGGTHVLPSTGGRGNELSEITEVRLPFPLGLSQGSPHRDHS